MASSVAASICILHQHHVLSVFAQASESQEERTVVLYVPNAARRQTEPPRVLVICHVGDIVFAPYRAVLVV